LALFKSFGLGALESIEFKSFVTWLRLLSTSLVFAGVVGKLVVELSGVMELSPAEVSAAGAEIVAGAEGAVWAAGSCKEFVVGTV